ncbi:head GIN domain-containing protein [uncultured Nonlabens sp.]|uniref:head GIN domain-containing protein n=1 Tax=uncultured Nonlabens sp. TaxID=859306 RepID=UPI00261133A6|nr:head GIN domain-containing protein [uncultured Nonlabens sp.]
MNRLLFTVTILFCVFSIAQNPSENTISDFDTIKVFDLITVNLVKSSENKIVISGEDVDDVEYIEKNGLLKVRMRPEKAFDGSKTFVHVYYKELYLIDANEGSRVFSNELIELDRLQIKVQEGAMVTAGLIVKNLDVKAVTGGIVRLSGQVEDQILVVNTGGIVENAQLKSDYSKVKLQAGGDVEIFATQFVDINIRAGGDVVVYGNPKDVKEKTLFGGSIMILDKY